MRYNKFLGVFSLMLIIGLAFSCEEKVEKKKDEVVKVVPKINADSAYAYVKKQVDFGPRVPNTAEHAACGNWIIGQLKSLGLKVSEQNFDAYAYDGKKLQLKNIVSSYNPKAKKRIMLAAHWDTRPFADKDDTRKDEPILGANDGGSGVGLLLEIARTLSADTTLNIGVDFFFFDGEDYGTPIDYDGTRNLQYSGYCLGSKYWAESKHAKVYKPRYGILLDMVGAKDARFFKEGYSNAKAPGVVNKVWNMASKIGYSPRFVPQVSPGITDDHTPVNEIAGIKMIDIIEYKPGDDFYFAPYHHTHDDNMNIIDRATLTAVGNVVLHVLYNE